MQFRDSGLERGAEVAELLQFVFEQVDDGFGVGIGAEDVAQALESLAQFFVILDDAVVHHRQLLPGEMRVSVALARRTVGGPTSVGNAQTPGQWLGLQRGLQFADLADAAAAIQCALLGQERHTGAVIAAIFQTLEAFDQGQRVILRSAMAPTIPHMGLSLVFQRHEDQLNAPRAYLFGSLGIQALVGYQGMEAAPGQFQIGNASADLVALDHDDDFTGHLGHHPRQTEQLVEGGGATLQVDAIGADEQLVEVVGAQHLFGHLALKDSGVRPQVPPVISSTGSCSSSRRALATPRELVITTRPGLWPSCGIIAAVVVPLSMMMRACSRMRATPARAIACLYGEIGWVGSLISSCGTGTAPP